MIIDDNLRYKLLAVAEDVAQKAYSLEQKKEHIVTLQPWTELLSIYIYDELVQLMKELDNDRED